MSAKAGKLVPSNLLSPALMGFCCLRSASRLAAGSHANSNLPASSLGSNNSMESAKTAAAAAQRLPQKDADMIEQAREAAADVEWLHEQVCCVRLEQRIHEYR